MYIYMCVYIYIYMKPFRMLFELTAVVKNCEYQ